MTYKYNQSYQEKEDAINKLISDNGLEETVPKFRYNKSYNEKEDILNAIMTAIEPGYALSPYKYNMSYQEKENFINYMIDSEPATDGNVIGRVLVNGVATAGATCTITINSNPYAALSIGDGTFDIQDVESGTGNLVIDAGGDNIKTVVGVVVVADQTTDVGDQDAFAPSNVSSLVHTMDARITGNFTTTGNECSAYADDSGNGNGATTLTGAGTLLYENDTLKLVDGAMSYSGFTAKECYAVVSEVEGTSINTSGAVIASDDVDDFVFLAEIGNGYTMSLDGTSGNTGSVQIDNGTRATGSNVVITDPTGFTDGFPVETTKRIVNFNVDNGFTNIRLGAFSTTNTAKLHIHALYFFDSDLTTDERNKMITYCDENYVNPPSV